MNAGTLIRCIANNTGVSKGDECIGHMFTVEHDAGSYIIASYWGEDPLLEWADYIFEPSEIQIEEN